MKEGWLQGLDSSVYEQVSSCLSYYAFERLAVAANTELHLSSQAAVHPELGWLLVFSLLLSLFFVLGCCCGAGLALGLLLLRPGLDVWWSTSPRGDVLAAYRRP